MGLKPIVRVSSLGSPLLSDDLGSVISLPPDAGADLRRHLGLKASDPVRITYVPGPGDVVGTFGHWQAGRHEPRIPTIAYSLMFYELMDRLDADCQILPVHPIGASDRMNEGKFHFEHTMQPPSSGRWTYLKSQFLYARALISAVERYDPHIVVTAGSNPSLSWKKLSDGRKLVVTVHNTFWPMGRPPQGTKGRLRKALLSSQAGAIDAAICTSHECARQLAHVTNDRVDGHVECPQIVSHYPVETRDKARNLLFLGRILHSKGVFLLLDAFDRLAERHPDLTLTIAGTGYADEEVRTRVAGSPHSDRIRFLGRVDSDGVHSEIASADLLVCPTMTSFNEGLAVVGFEAAAHGIPTVLSSVVPAAELLGESCTIYEADDGDALCDALAGLVEDPGLYRDKCALTSDVREKIYDRSLSWGSGLFRALMRA